RMLRHRTTPSVCTRTSDVRINLARRPSPGAYFGGEEFAVLLPDTDGQTAIAIAEKIRKAISDVGMPHEGSEFGIVTASLGATVFTSESRINNPAELVARADLALYQAKDAGRDRVGFQRLAAERTMQSA
ncbi:GGDEF domain-containing protein, partial [Rhizobium rosettiformans]|uniref:GGDEF domain-containing protein n=1 Tax=Rhizobium rosettiformans TaxID=1368430 RepID=UPI00286CE9A9